MKHFLLRGYEENDCGSLQCTLCDLVDRIKECRSSEYFPQNSKLKKVLILKKSYLKNKFSQNIKDFSTNRQVCIVQKIQVLKFYIKKMRGKVML